MRKPSTKTEDQTCLVSGSEVKHVVFLRGLTWLFLVDFLGFTPYW